MAGMSDETKARLRAAAEAKKGTTTLAGFNAFGWAACLDEVVSGNITLPLNRYSDSPATGRVRCK